MKSAIEYYNQFAEEYDKLAKSGEFHWLSPDVIFGLAFEYLKKGQKLLDIGIGTGLSSVNFFKFGLKVYGIEGSEKMLEKCRIKKIAKILKKVDIENEKIPFEDGMFDIVIADGVLYFLKDLTPIVKEVNRVLKHKGIFVFTVEERKGNEDVEYINIDNDLVSKEIKDKTGVLVYRHDFSKVGKILTQLRFTILKMLNFLAYTSPSTKKDVYFTAIVCRIN